MQRTSSVAAFLKDLQAEQVAALLDACPAPPSSSSPEADLQMTGANPSVQPGMVTRSSIVSHGWLQGTMHRERTSRASMLTPSGSVDPEVAQRWPPDCSQGWPLPAAMRAPAVSSTYGCYGVC